MTLAETLFAQMLADAKEKGIIKEMWGDSIANTSLTKVIAKQAWELERLFRAAEPTMTPRP